MIRSFLNVAGERWVFFLFRLLTLAVIGAPCVTSAAATVIGDEATGLEELVMAARGAQLQPQTQATLDALSLEWSLELTGLDTQEKAVAFLAWFEEFKATNDFRKMRFYIQETQKLSPGFRASFPIVFIFPEPALDRESVYLSCLKARIAARSSGGKEPGAYLNALLVGAGIGEETISDLEDSMSSKAYFFKEPEAQAFFEWAFIDLLCLNDSQLMGLLKKTTQSRWIWSDSAPARSQWVPVDYQDVFSGDLFFDLRRRLEVVASLTKLKLNWVEVGQNFIHELSRTDFDRFKTVVLPRLARLGSLHELAIDSISIEDATKSKEYYTPYSKTLSVEGRGLQSIENTIERFAHPEKIELTVSYDGYHEASMPVFEAAQIFKSQEKYLNALEAEGFILEVSHRPEEFERVKSWFERQRSSNRFKKIQFQIQETRKQLEGRPGYSPSAYQVPVGFHSDELPIQARLGGTELGLREPLRKGAVLSVGDDGSEVKIDRSYFASKHTSIEVAELLASGLEEGAKVTFRNCSEQGRDRTAIFDENALIDALALSDFKNLKTIQNAFYNLGEAERKKHPASLSVDSSALLSVGTLAYDPCLSPDLEDVFPNVGRIAITWGRLRGYNADRVRISPRLIVNLTRSEFVHLNTHTIPRLQSLAVNKLGGFGIHLIFDDATSSAVYAEKDRVIEIRMKSLSDLEKHL
jgi:hypothetical protein